MVVIVVEAVCEVVEAHPVATLEADIVVDTEAVDEAIPHTSLM